MRGPRKSRQEPDDEDFRILVDLSHAEREAARISGMLAALRKRHDLSRYEFTRLVQIQPAGATRSHPILTLGTRFADTEDMLLATYLHEQMHWYLWRLGGPDHDPVAPFFDELVRRYPKAPTSLPEGARNYEQTYLHLVVCWLEVAATTELIGADRAKITASAPWGYRWIYRTVLQDWEALGDLFRANGLLPLLTPAELERTTVGGVPVPASTSRSRPPRKAAPAASAAPRRKLPAAKRLPSRKIPRRIPARGGNSAG